MVTRTKQAIEFDKKQNEKMTELLYGPEPETQMEKDIFNLKVEVAGWSMECGGR